MSETKRASIQYLPTQSLQPNPFQPREKIKSEEIQDLIVSVKMHGILEPLVVAQTPAGYQIIAGERRWRAARELKLPEVPVIVRRTTPKGMLEMAIVENIQRVDLNPIERAQGFYQLFRDFRHTQSEIAQKLGKSVAYISNSIKLLELPDAVKDGLIGGIISEGHARAIVSIDDDKSRIEVYKQVLKEDANVRRTEDLARKMKQKLGQDKENRGHPQLEMSQQFEKWAQQLADSLPKASDIKITRSKARTKLVIVLKGNQEETQPDLEKILSIAEKKRD